MLRNWLEPCGRVTVHVIHTAHTSLAHTPLYTSTADYNPAPSPKYIQPTPSNTASSSPTALLLIQGEQAEPLQDLPGHRLLRTDHH